MPLSKAPFLGMQPGFYSQHCVTQGTAVAACADLLVRACSEVQLPSHNQPLDMAEWGCAHGTNSIMPVALVCDTLRQRLEQATTPDLADPAIGDQGPLQVHITHEDVPDNDWKAMMASIQQYKALVGSAGGSDGPTRPDLRLTSACVGTSMYERNFPTCSLDLGFSFTTLHWQSARACVPKHAVTTLGSKVLREEDALLQAHAMQDLATFLQLRAEEFKPGGMLVLSYSAVDSSKGLTNEHAYHLAAVQAAAEELVRQGLLHESELGLMAPPMYTLDVPQQQQVLAEVSGLWEVLAFDTFMCTSPLWDKYLAGGMSAAAYGKVFADFWRAVSEPFIISALSQSGKRCQLAVVATVEALFDRMAATAALDPKPMQYPATRVLLRRRGAARSPDSSHAGSSM